MTACLKIGQGSMHHLGSRYIIDAPGVWQPVCSRDGLIAVPHVNVWDFVVYVAGGMIGLLRRAGATVDRCIDAPDGRMVMNPLQSHDVLTFCPNALLRHPQSFVHSLQDGICLILIRFWILADHLCHTCCQFVSAIVIGRGMRHRPTTIVECVRGPDTTIGIVEMVAVRVIVTFLPSQM